jgi:hypothetical protein
MEQVAVQVNEDATSCRAVVPQYKYRSFGGTLSVLEEVGAARRQLARHGGGCWRRFLARVLTACAYARVVAADLEAC